jgi:hypothetical protein
MKSIRQMIKEAQDRHKSYVDTHSNDHNYEIGDKVFLWVKPIKVRSSLERVKISPRFVDLSKLWKRKDHGLSTSLS